MGDLVLVAVLIAAALGISLAVPSTLGRLLASVFGIVGLGILVSRLVPIGHWGFSVFFYLFSLVTLFAAVSTVSTRHPIYCAVWFGVVLLGTSGLLLLAGAQFLAIATLLIYAGAILVIFLFVLMLAQPEGGAPYDRDVFRPVVVSLVGIVLAVLAAGTAISLLGTGELLGWAAEVGDRSGGVLQQSHVFAIGQELYSRYLIALEVVAAILLVALIGAALIVGRAEGFILGPRGGSTREQTAIPARSGSAGEERGEVPAGKA